MQYSFTALALLAVSGLAVAQIPACAKPAIDAATESVGCTINDLACACTAENQAGIQAAATADVVASCGIETAINEVLPAAQALCANPPPAESSAAPEPETTAAEPTTSAEQTIQTSTPPATTAAPSSSPSPSGNATNSSAPTSAVPSSTIVPASGAAQALASVGSVFALGLAVLAAF